MRSAKLPQVGVVIPNYNNAAYVVEAIESAARQTISNIQVVVIDDASTDNSDEVIRETLAKLADPRFRYIRLETNCGQMGAVRRGIAELETPFLCFLDSDDVWYENFIECHLAAHMNTDFPVGFTYCDSHFINGNSELVASTAWWFERPYDDPSHRPVCSGKLPRIDIKAGRAEFPPNPTMVVHAEWSPTWSSNSTAAMMFRRDIVMLVLPPDDTELRLYLDFYLSTFTCLLVGAIAIHDALYCYRMHGKNKHSDGLVLGGTSQTSRKNFGPISRRVMELILTVMLERKGEIIELLDFNRYDQAVRALRQAISHEGPPSLRRRMLASMRRMRRSLGI
jgi:glycosyltransferase involved in cell wall biosynthesis